MKTLLTVLLVAAAFWFGTRYTLTPRASSGQSVPRVEQQANASSRAHKVAKAKPAPSSKPAATFDLGF